VKILTVSFENKTYAEPFFDKKFFIKTCITLKSNTSLIFAQYILNLFSWKLINTIFVILLTTSNNDDEISVGEHCGRGS